MPMRSGRQPDVMTDPRPHPSRSQGATDVDVAARLNSESAQSSNLDDSGLVRLQNEGIGAGVRIHFRGHLYSSSQVSILQGMRGNMSHNRAEPGMSMRTRYTLPGGTAQGHLLGQLQTRFPVELTSLGTQTRHYFDTFDWRLFRRGLALCQARDTVALWSLDNRPVSERTSCSALPPWVSEWAESPLKAQLLPLVSIRALLERAVVHAAYFTLAEQTAPRRPVAHIVFEEGAATDYGRIVPLPTQVEVTAYAGSAVAGELRAWLDSLDSTTVSPSGPAATLYTVQQARAYSAKLAFTFEPDMRAEDAVRTILAFLLDIVRQNRPGILHDIDTEFLHDFRVAVRRARSLLGQLPTVLPVGLTQHLRADLSFLGSLTNHLRDLDVLLLQQADYLAVLPTELRPDMEPLFRAVQHERYAAQHRLVEALNTPQAEAILQRWESATTETKAQGPQAKRRLEKLVRKSIRRQCRRVLTFASPDTLKDSAPEQLHRLRIACKKLRYMFEFFASAFPQEMTAGPVRRLRVLQDVLGQLNDLDVQQQMLRQLARAVPGRAGQHHRTERAVHLLTQTFETRQEQLRVQVHTTLRDFIAEVAPWS